MIGVEVMSIQAAALQKQQQRRWRQQKQQNEEKNKQTKRLSSVINDGLLESARGFSHNQLRAPLHNSFPFTRGKRGKGRSDGGV